MEKNITREVKVYKYTFGHVDTATLSASDTVIVRTAHRMSGRKLNQKSKELDGRVFLKCEEETAKYSLPLVRFIEACESYAKAVQDNAANSDNT